MCGIAGYADFGGGSAEEAAVAAMVGLLSHRGPDGKRVQVLNDGNRGPAVVFGHSRLAVIDLSEAAAQPMANENRSVWVTFNGEIYNFKELHEKLVSLGHSFATNSDTEVIVHAYESFGPGFVQQLDGMFAFAVWDSKQELLTLARDRAGKKPLFYSQSGSRLTFASETKALRACEWIDGSIEWERLPELLTLGYLREPQTMHTCITQVSPGCTVTLRATGAVSSNRYWQLRFDGLSGKGPSWKEAESRVQELLKKGVTKRLVSDVPVGVLLSGGLDSSAIVALLSNAGHSPRTFCAAVEGAPSYDERKYAALVANRFGTEHVELPIGPDVASLVETVAWHLDQPMADSSAVPTYLISKAAREHITVALTGDGGDEVFGGYERFAAALLAERTPALAQKVLARSVNFVPNTSGYFNPRKRLERFFQSVGSSARDRYQGWVNIFTEQDLKRCLFQGLPAQMTPQSNRLFEPLKKSDKDLPLLHYLIDANFRGYLPDDLLVKSDRMSMANSLEIRCPFLDTELVEYVAGLPPEMKANSFSLKRILRRAMAGAVPREILMRRKHGLGVPVAQWFRSQLKDPFQDLVLSNQAKSSPVLNQAGVRAMFEEHLAGTNDHGSRLWSLLMLEAWLRVPSSN